jgi:hypothetical protein
LSEYVPPAYVLQRIAIEQRHVGDDGTDAIIEREARERAIYTEREPITEWSPTVVLKMFGASQREVNTLVANGCEYIFNVRDACRRDTEIPAWDGCGPAFRDRVRRIIRDMDEVMGR